MALTPGAGMLPRVASVGRTLLIASPHTPLSRTAPIPIPPAVPSRCTAPLALYLDKACKMIHPL